MSHCARRCRSTSRRSFSHEKTPRFTSPNWLAFNDMMPSVSWRWPPSDHCRSGVKVAHKTCVHLYPSVGLTAWRKSNSGMTRGRYASGRRRLGKAFGQSTHEMSYSERVRQTRCSGGSHTDSQSLTREASSVFSLAQGSQSHMSVISSLGTP